MTQDKNLPVFRLLDKTKVNFFFLGLFLFQVLFIFQGIDIADEGFHSTFYQQIYHNSQSVEYNFMYWFSGIVGGAWLKLFPGYGLLGLRLGGVILNMLAVIGSYRLLKNYTRPVYLKLGLLLLVLINGAAVKDINYNNISAILFICSILFIFSGLKKNKLFDLLIAGGFVSLAVFSRLANISGLALIAAIIYSGFFVFKQSIAHQVKQIVFFVLGFIIITILVIGAMKISGQYVLFIDSIKLLKSMANSGENTHDMAKLIKIILGDYTTAVFKRTLPLCIFVLLYNMVLNQVKSDHRLSTLLRYVVTAGFVLFLSGFILLNGTLTLWTFYMMLFAAMSLLASLFLVIGKNNKELALISLAGTITTFSLIAGADYGISASGSTALWIGLPVAIDFFMRIFSVKIGGSFDIRDSTDSKSGNLGINLSVTPQQLKRVWYWGIYSCGLVLCLHAVLYTYNDNPDRTKMTFPVHNAFLKGVLTTRERAAAINELLEASPKYLKRNEYVITYRDIPLFYTLTQTMPFIKNSWPSLYTRSQFDYELNTAVTEHQVLPPIVYQKVQTIPGPFWPAPTPNNTSFDIDSPKNVIIKKFIDKYEYKLK
ncbi:MAG TPA: hypothetical protein VII28_15245, partial [Puia sp.]